MTVQIRRPINDGPFRTCGKCGRPITLYEKAYGTGTEKHCATCFNLKCETESQWNYEQEIKDVEALTESLRSSTMTDDTTAQPPKKPRPATKRLKHYRLRTNIADDAGELLTILAERHKMSRTEWLEMTIRNIAWREGLTE